MRRYPAGRRLYLDCEEAAVFQDAENVADTGSVRRDVRVPRFNENAGRVVLPAEDSAVAEVVEDLLLNLLFEDGSSVNLL